MTVCFICSSAVARCRFLDNPAEVERQRLHLVHRLTPPAVVSLLQSAVSAALARNVPCVPSGAVLISYANVYHAPFMELTRQALQRDSPHCDVLQRTVAVCFGHNASSACVRAPHASRSDHRHGQYHEIIWIKWNIIDFVLQVAQLVFFFDADVVLLQNPFRALALGLRAPLSALDFGLMYQPTGPWEGPIVRHPAMPLPSPSLRTPTVRTGSSSTGDAADKSGGSRRSAAWWPRASQAHGPPLCGDVTTLHPGHEVNGGQLLISSRALVRAVLDAKPLAFKPSSQLDQVTVSRLLGLDLSNRPKLAGPAPEASTILTESRGENPQPIDADTLHAGHRLSSGRLGVQLPTFDPRNRYHACMLPEGFAEHCWCRDNATCAADACHLVSYHATCLSTFEQKYAGARAAVERFEQSVCRRRRRVAMGMA